VEEYLESWVSRDTEIEAVQVKKPIYPKIPLPPVLLVKGEFEPTKDFNIRVAKQEDAYQEKLNTIKQKYTGRVKVYNSAVKAYNNEIHWEQERRREQAVAMRSRLLNVAINEILGEPKMLKLKYDADKELFAGRVVAADNTVYYDIVVPVILKEAPDFKKNVKRLDIFVKMSLNGEIKPASFKIKNFDKVYFGSLISEEKSVKNKSIAEIDLNSIKIKKTKDLKVDGIVENNNKYFRTLKVDNIVTNNKKYFKKPF
jgi:hypothetical protein